MKKNTIQTVFSYSSLDSLVMLTLTLNQTMFNPIKFLKNPRSDNSTHVKNTAVKKIYPILISIPEIKNALDKPNIYQRKKHFILEIYTDGIWRV